jgi:hypothetical protein
MFEKRLQCLSDKNFLVSYHLGITINVRKNLNRANNNIIQDKSLNRLELY